MASSSSRNPLTVVGSLTTAAITATAVGTGALTIHLASDHAVAAASRAGSSQTSRGLEDGDRGRDELRESQLPAAGGQDFGPVAPLQGGGGAPQGSTGGS
jgi:hypothetical protein